MGLHGDKSITAEGGRQVNNEQQTQTQQADDPSGPAWRDVGLDELLQPGDMYPIGDRWEPTTSVGAKARVFDNGYRRRIEQPQPSDTEPGWRDVTTGSVTQDGDMVRVDGQWCEARTGETVFDGDIVRRRIQQPQPSDREPETMEQLRRRLAECEVLLAEAERSGQQVNAELQQLREQLATSQHLAEMSRRQVADEASKVEQLKERVQKLERELKAERDSSMTALRSQNRLGQEALAEALQTWLRPVIELVAEHPDDCGPLAVSVLGYLPGIASRLIEE
jgi:hypothetical protein